LVFYTLVTGIALVMRLRGRDVLGLSLDRQAKTYWTPHATVTDPGRYFRQFELPFRSETSMTTSSPNDPNRPNPASSRFEQQAEQQDPGLLVEFWDFLRYNGKWWMTPILIVLFLVAALLVLNALGLSPFVYTLG
jgi:hypothetical protein